MTNFLEGAGTKNYKVFPLRPFYCNNKMWEALFVLRVLCFLGSSNHSWASEKHRWCNALWRNRLSPFCPQCQSHWPTFQWKDFLLPTSNKYFTHLKWCKHKWNVLNGHPVHWKSFNRAPLRCEMATTGTQVSLLLSVSHAHTLWNTHKGKKEHLIFSVSKTVHTPQPNLQIIYCCVSTECLAQKCH